MPYQYFGYLGFPQTYGWLMALAILWTVPWKGYALWKAARNSSPWWFVALLVINTLGVLEILYIFVFGRNDKPVCCCPCEDCTKGKEKSHAHHHS